MKTDTLRESQLEKKFVGLVQNRGGLARKFVSPNQRGVPDRIVVWPGGRVHFVELKTRNGKLSKLQISEQKKLMERRLHRPHAVRAGRCDEITLKT